MKFITLAIAIFALTFLSCQPKGQAVFEHGNYSISYDKDYDIDKSGVNGTDFYIALPGDANKNFRDNINLLVQDLTGTGLDLEKFVDLTESQIKSSGRLVKSERINRNGMEYQSILFEADFGNGDHRFLQYDFVQDGKAYVLTYTATMDTFEENLSNAREVMNSFKLNRVPDSTNTF